MLKFKFMTDKKDTYELLRENLGPLLEKQADMLMAQYDTNGDGIIEFEEVLMCVPGYADMPDVAKDVVKENLRSDFDKWDVNKDGKVEKHEMAKFMENTTMEMMKPQIEEAEKALKLEIAASFAKADKDEDGFLNKEEFDAMLIDVLENDEDEQSKEFTKETMNWDLMDTNKDDKISFEELWNRASAIAQRSMVEEMKKEMASAEE